MSAFKRTVAAHGAAALFAVPVFLRPPVLVAAAIRVRDRHAAEDARAAALRQAEVDVVEARAAVAQLSRDREAAQSRLSEAKGRVRALGGRGEP